MQTVLCFSGWLGFGCIAVCILADRRASARSVDGVHGRVDATWLGLAGITVSYLSAVVGLLTAFTYRPSGVRRLPRKRGCLASYGHASRHDIMLLVMYVRVRVA